MENKKGWIGKLLMEFVSVVFAVLLALGLNHWREERANQELADKALTNIFIEVFTNKNDLEEQFPIYEENIASVGVYKAEYDSGKGGYYSLKFNLPVLSKAAWNVANSTGAIKDVDLTLLMELSDMYAFQDVIQTNSLNYLETMNSLSYKKDENAEAIVNANYDQLKLMKSWSEQLHAGYLNILEVYGPQYQELLPDSVLVEGGILE